MSFLGIDIGSTGCKAAIFSESGNCLGQAYREYQMLPPQPGWMELDPPQVGRSVKEVIERKIG
ncbi:hypothetical protein LCGC14_2703120 [marine sediment metagenome]|uniref:Carbohydrate kinase FGGY N-terminal domain-containing protein n=1 Tax=marine sediment metagenome TaxID=412755 RepID=A0A0F9BPD3_9ZZZZ